MIHHLVSSFSDDFNYGFDPMQRNDINADVAIVPEDAVSETDTQGYSQIVPLSPTASDTSSQMQSIQHRRPRQRRRRSTRIATTDPVTILPATFYGRTADITTTRPMQTSRKVCFIIHFMIQDRFTMSLIHLYYTTS